MIQLIRALGTVILLGGLAHSAGVARAPRVRSRGLGQSPIREMTASGRALAAFGALTIITFSMAMLPVLIARAPLILRVPPIAYSIASLAVLWRLSFRISAGG